MLSSEASAAEGRAARGTDRARVGEGARRWPAGTAGPDGDCGETSQKRCAGHGHSTGRLPARRPRDSVRTRVSRVLCVCSAAGGCGLTHGGGHVWVRPTQPPGQERSLDGGWWEV